MYDMNQVKAQELAELYKVFGDATRIRIMCALHDKELCGGDLVQILGIGQSVVSHQLKILKDAKLVCTRREGQKIFYSLSDEHVSFILGTGIEHLEEK